MSRKQTLVFILIMTLILLVIYWPRIKRSLAIDRCLDSGGRWNYETNICETSNVP